MSRLAEGWTAGTGDWYATREAAEAAHPGAKARNMDVPRHWIKGRPKESTRRRLTPRESAYETAMGPAGRK